MIYTNITTMTLTSLKVHTQTSQAMVQVFIECKSPEATQCSFAKVRLLKQKKTPMTTWAVRHPPYVLLICLNSFGPKKDWIFCARFSPEPGLPHWAQANNPRNWGSQRCPKIHWRHRSAFKSHKCKRPKLSCCVEVIECPILYVDQMWGLTNSLQDSVCWVCEPDGGGWWFISRDEHGRLEARWLLAIPTWSTQVGFTIESCTLFLSPIRLENLSPSLYLRPRPRSPVKATRPSWQRVLQEPFRLWEEVRRQRGDWGEGARKTGFKIDRN